MFNIVVYAYFVYGSMKDNRESYIFVIKILHCWMGACYFDLHAGSCVNASYTGCCDVGQCRGLPEQSYCYCDVDCYQHGDCCSDIGQTCQSLQCKKMLKYTWLSNIICIITTPRLLQLRKHSLLHCSITMVYSKLSKDNNYSYFIDCMHGKAS